MSWPEALDAASAGLQAALDARGPSSIAVLGGARGTNEDAYVWARFAKSVLGTDNVDAQLADGLPAEVVLGLAAVPPSPISTARARSCCVAPDLKEELPVLYLRVRRAAVDLGVPVIEIAPRATGLTRDVTAVLRHAPGEAGAIARAVRPGAGRRRHRLRRRLRSRRRCAALDGRDGDLVVVLGRQSLAESADVGRAGRGRARRRFPDVKFLSALRRGNVRGALDLGLTPGFLPGPGDARRRA